MDSGDFRIFPWQRHFLPDLKNFVEEQTEGFAGSALIIVPHRRPWRYICQLFANGKKPCVLPKVLTSTEVVDIWQINDTERPQYIAHSLDQAAMLHKCVLELANTDKELCARFEAMDMGQFMPWGLKLAGLLEELFVNGIEPRDIANLEGEVEKPAAALLAALGRIGATWRQKLGDKNWSTPGFESYKAQRNAASIPNALLPKGDRPVFIAGFNALNGTEEKLFRSLWTAGAHICLHTDPALAEGRQPHWSCQDHQAWIRRWRALPLPGVPDGWEASVTEPQISFFAGYDCHSQLLQMKADLAKSENATEAGIMDSTAIILARPNLLMPVLHHLPQKDVNISMGYPLNRTPLNNLIEDVFSLQENKAHNGNDGEARYYWRDLLRLFNHPYLNMLAVEAAGGKKHRLREALHALARIVRNGEKYTSAGALLQQYHKDNPEAPSEVEALLCECLDLFLTEPEKMQTLGQMAALLLKIYNLFQNNAAGIIRRFPLDAEALARMRQNVIPVLENNEDLAREKFNIPALHSILSLLLDGERVAFESDPLVGVQIMGMLESRLLNFKNILVLDASDDILPGSAALNPLLPDSLRSLIGLPDSRARDRIQAHNFFRLCAGSEQARIYWQEGIIRSSMFEGKKSRSRFVEQLLWQMEQKGGKLLKEGEYPLEVARASVRSPHKSLKKISRSSDLDAALDKFFKYPLSPTRLDDYLTCPYRFAINKILGIKKPAEVNEGEDSPLVGECVHKTLYEYFAPWVGRNCKKEGLSLKLLEENFHEQFKDFKMRDKLPVESWLMLAQAGPLRLRTFYSKMPPETFIQALEKEFTARLSFPCGTFNFDGIVDRLDRRKDSLLILDYKTGRLKKYDDSLWNDAAFLARMESYASGAQKFDEGADALLTELKERLPSLQLPIYMVLVAANEAMAPANAAFVDLYDSGEEKSLFGSATLDKPVDTCKSIISFVLAHLKNSPQYSACEGDACRYCDYAGLCKS